MSEPVVYTLSETPDTISFIALPANDVPEDDQGASEPDPGE